MATSTTLPPGGEWDMFLAGISALNCRLYERPNGITKNTTSKKVATSCKRSAQYEQDGIISIRNAK